MKKLLFLCFIAFIAKTSSAQTITVSDWQSGKKLLSITKNEARNWITNEMVLYYEDGIYSDPKTGAKMYQLDKDDILSDAKSGTKLYEYKEKKVIDAKTSKVMFVFNPIDKSIAEGESGKKLLQLSKSDVFSYRIFFILIANGLIK